MPSWGVAGTMGTIPDVSVIIAVYNGMPYIRETLDSLLRQTIGLARMQVLIVDDGSTDETPAFIDGLAAIHPSIEVIHQPNSGGPAGPRNRAIDSARGRFMFFLDADDYLSDDALEAMVGMADANGTDVVLARIKGLGGRPTPRTMFTRTLPRTDVFSSSVYWTLNPMKLFRTELVRRLDLRFPIDLPWGEDQPFVASAYLKGDGISVLADKDHVFWRNRDDRSNITIRAVALADRMPVADRMFDFVAGIVPPGPDRDRLLGRHFHIELMSAFSGYRTEPDPEVRAAAFRRFREIIDSHFNESIQSALPPADRVSIRLVSEGRQAEFAEYLEVLAHAGPPSVCVEGQRVFLGLPWFRETGRDLPDDLFDIGGQLRAECRVESLTTTGGGVRLSAACRLGLLTDRVSDVGLVVRPRAGGDEIVLPLAHRIELEETRPFVRVEDSLTADRLLGRLETGGYTLHVRISSGGVSRERRLSECAASQQAARFVRRSAEDGSVMSGLLTASSQGALSLRAIDGFAADVLLTDTPAGPRIEVASLPRDAGGRPPGPLRLVGGGRERELPLADVKDRGPDHVMCFDARGLAGGTYSMRIALPDSEGTRPLVAIRATQAVGAPGRGGCLRIDGSAIKVTPEWRLRAARAVRPLRRWFKRISRTSPAG